jgi:hypothetical protein
LRGIDSYARMIENEFPMGGAPLIKEFHKQITNIIEEKVLKGRNNIMYSNNQQSSQQTSTIKNDKLINEELLLSPVTFNCRQNRQVYENS